MRAQILAYLLITFLYCLIIVTSSHALTIDAFDTFGIAFTPDQPTSAVTATSASGGTRSYHTEITSGPGDGLIRVSTSGSGLHHDQGSGVLKGRSQIVWDGDTNTSSINYLGLGGLSLIQDSATAFVIKNLTKDNNRGTIYIFVYDRSDSTGQKYSRFSLNLSGPEIATPTDFIILFSSADEFGPNGSANFANIGAMRLVVDGTIDSGLDIDFTDLITNGFCTQIPTVGEKVVDDCGVCRGNNANKDVCGVCNGDNSTCKDCAGTPNGTTKLDQCNICGGDGKSCLDCFGSVFGTAKFDVCRVCNGNGQSCLECISIDNTPSIDALNAKVDEFIANVEFFLQGVIKSDKRFRKSAKKEIKKIQSSLVKSISTLPARTDSCGNTVLCTKVSVNGAILADIDDLLDKLSIIGNDIIDKLKPVRGGKCTRTAKECKKTIKQQKTKVRSFKSLIKSLHRQATEIKDSIPAEQSICTDGSSV